MFIIFCTVIITISRVTSVFCSHPNTVIAAPRAGSHFTWISRLSWFFSAKRIIARGHAELGQYPFKICGDDVLVLPARYVDEIKNAPSNVLNSILALLENTESKYAITDVLSEDELHTRVIRTRLTPKLGKYMDVLKEEFAYGMTKDFPKITSDQWTSVTVYPVMHAIVARMSARAFVGPHLCRNEKWLHHAEGYTNSAFPTIIVMRLIPDFLKRFASWILPTPWITKYHAYCAFQILLPEIVRRQRLAAQSEQNLPEITENGADTPFEDNFLQMMIDEAQGDAARPESLAGRVLSLSLGSTHTTTMALTETLYDLCTYPQYQQELRDEAHAALREHGGWCKASLTSLKKLDSFMNESRRLNPPSQMGFKRNALVPYTFKDGYTLPVGAHIQFAIVPIQRDATTEPDEFDGLRYYRRRLEPSQSHKWQFATTDSTILHFGHGRYACPGRFMASNVIKLVLANLLLDYDFQFEMSLRSPEHGGLQRPKSWTAFEYSFPNPLVKVSFRKRASDIN